MSFYKKYKAFPAIELKNRSWPDQKLTQAPNWCSVDLRDGNQALVNPMVLNQKIDLFNTLVDMGFKEIEVGFPAASETEFNFIRHIIHQGLIPKDVTIQVLTQARENLIKRSIESLAGCKQAILHLYNSTSIAQRNMVFNTDVKGIIDIALQGISWIKQYQKNQNCSLTLQYSPESFTGTECDVALNVCSEVISHWHQDEPVIINLPATVEHCMPNQYADMIEWMHQNLPNRDRITLSIHTHNDRGTGVAASELALLAGATRVEGTLFGNGERTGNVDIITLALNLATQGIDPKLKLDHLPKLTELIESITNIPTHPRHPYAGELVFTAFSGSHQDAIKKGMDYYKTNKQKFWDVPYLTIDPKDISRSYEAMIRINSQSGKGGIAYILDHAFGCQLPKTMQPEFSKHIQQLSEKLEEEIPANMIWKHFKSYYLDSKTPFDFISFTAKEHDKQLIEAQLEFTFNKHVYHLSGKGNGPIDAAKMALSSVTQNLKICHYATHSRKQGSKSEAVAYIQLEYKSKSCFGVGIDTNSTLAAIKALFSALNILHQSN